MLPTLSPSSSFPLSSSSLSSSSFLPSPSLFSSSSLSSSSNAHPQFLFSSLSSSNAFPHIFSSSNAYPHFLSPSPSTYSTSPPLHQPTRPSIPLSRSDSSSVGNSAHAGLTTLLSPPHDTTSSIDSDSDMKDITNLKLSYHQFSEYATRYKQSQTWKANMRRLAVHRKKHPFLAEGREVYDHYIKNVNPRRIRKQTKSMAQGKGREKRKRESSDPDISDSDSSDSDSSDSESDNSGRILASSSKLFTTAGVVSIFNMEKWCKRTVRELRKLERRRAGYKISESDSSSRVSLHHCASCLVYTDASQPPQHSKGCMLHKILDKWVADIEVPLKALTDKLQPHV